VEGKGVSAMPPTGEYLRSGGGVGPGPPRWFPPGGYWPKSAFRRSGGRALTTLATLLTGYHSGNLVRLARVGPLGQQYSQHCGWRWATHLRP